MEVLPVNSLLSITWDDVNYARKFYVCEDVKAINESLDNVEEWMKKQDHLAEASKYAKLWREEFRTERAWRIISESEQMVSDESKRSSSTFNEEYMGMPGSFRKLNVD